MAEVLNQSKKKMDCLNDSNRILFRKAEIILLTNLPFGSQEMAFEKRISYQNRMLLILQFTGGTLSLTRIPGFF